MKTIKCVYIIPITFLSFGIFILGGLNRAAAQADCPDCLTAVVLPTVAAKVEKNQPGQSFKGQPLEIAASAEKEPTKQSYLKFDVSAIPAGASIYSWTLRLYLEKQNDPEEFQLVRAFPVEDSAWKEPLTWNNRPSAASESVAGAEVNDRPTRINFEHTVGEDIRPCWLEAHYKGMGLMLQSPSASLDYTYYSITGSDNTCHIRLTEETDREENTSCFNTQPKLIVKYYMGLTVAETGWPQYNYDSQHSGRTPWKYNTHGSEVALNGVYSPAGYIKGDPVVYNGNLFFHTQTDVAAGKPELQGSGKFLISAVNGSGQPLWGNAQDIGAVVKFQPSVDQTGRLYIITENTLEILNLKDAGQKLKSLDWKAQLKSEEAVSIRSAPTLGYNGTLYLSTNKGIYALTPYPELNIFWKYTTSENAFGRITLSKDESVAYTVDAAQGLLVALDNTDGTPKWRRPIINLTTESDGSTCEKSTAQEAKMFQENPPVPVVGVNGIVYVTTGDYSGKCLHVFDAEGRNVTTISTAGRLSQPVIASNGNAIFINQENQGEGGKLCRYDSKAEDILSCNPKIEDQLSPRSRLVLDGNDNVYAIDRISDPQRVRGYTFEFQRLFKELQVAKTVSASDRESRNFLPNLLIAPDGTLYTRNDNHLFAITPKNLLVDYLVLKPGDAIQHETAFLAEKSITVQNVTIAKKSVILKSGGTIGFKPGFAVKKGARLSCKVGF
jgi:hypothetical protein